MPVSASSTPTQTASDADAHPERRTFLQVARQPRMIGLLLVFVLAALVCGRLGAWQLDRAYERAELAAQQQAAEAVAAGPSWLGDVLAPQESFPGELVGREVRVAGEFEGSGSLLVPGRVLEGHTGYLVLTPFRVTDDGTDGASWAGLSGAPVLAVVQGWVAAPADAETLTLPEDEVTLTGWLQVGESTSGSAAVVDGQTEQIALSALVNEWGGPIYTGYLVANGGPGSPESGGVAALPRPTIDGGSGANLQNVFYALQWWVFGGFAVLLWIRLVRDEMAGGRRGGEPTDADTGIAGLPSA
ncbi:SURF1 family protein [Promicromonospora sp. NPDC050249]|uniref:SURF1 family protein n=1 Tax=Promicromonospora sp. NPDC050249 TaxID=3154743 RepID=UPI0034050920